MFSGWPFTDFGLLVDICD